MRFDLWLQRNELYAIHVSEFNKQTSEFYPLVHLIYLNIAVQ